MKILKYEKVFFLNDTCMRCGDEGAYFNGVCWECPNCEHTWGCIGS